MLIEIVTNKDIYDKAAFWVNVALCVVGFAGVALAIITLRLVGKQTDAATASAKAATKAAEAADQSAQAYLGAERPFVLVEPRFETQDRVVYYAVNYGRSPARLLNYENFLNIEVLPMMSSLPVPPVYGQYTGENWTVLNGPWIAPGKEFKLAEMDKDAAERYLAIAEAEKIKYPIIYMFSRVRYAGMLDSQKFETRYCYRWLKERVAMAGPSGYNDNT